MVSGREMFSNSIVSWLEEFSRLSTGQENGDDNDPSYKMMEQFNRDLMEHQRKTRESFEKWEADRWRQEKEAIQKWKVESREHERALFDMFCNAMVKCNAALTAIFQAAKTSTSQSKYFSYQKGLLGHSFLDCAI